MGIATEVWRSVRYDGHAGCAHELLLQSVRPSASNADQRALDAADAFAEGSLDHLQAWFEQWRLPADCPGIHQVHVVGRSEDPADLDEPGFRWVEVWRVVTRDGWLTVAATPFAGAEPVTAYLLRSGRVPEAAP